ncbi:CHAT domain-containing protein [Nostoc sp. DedSLP04]|uniref:CHAT domain-containing protein n=1 Tax=Nostoc sp. DedSLP04 TaxID=3075401 RepID=UPI002AD36605|nr:tetratricopeptide repeat protein [Nostoc sp. DedSLP04]MDZ8034431.1 tetratricopeptide repeat protein [Nostoc sp. DedSLP04]
MSLRLRLVSWLISPLLLVFILYVLPIPSSLLCTTVQAQTNQDRKIEAGKLLQQGNQQVQRSQYQAAIQSWQQALAIYQELRDFNGQASSLMSLGIAYDSLGQYPNAINFYQQSLTIFRNIGDYKGEAKSLGNLGIVYGYLGQYTKAIDFFEQSVAIKRKIGDHKGEANSLGNLGSAYYYLGQYSKTIEFHEQSLAIFRDIGDRNGEGNSLMNVGSAYHNLGQYSKAIEFYEQSLTIKRKIGDRNGEAKSLGNLGNVYQSLGKYAKAIDFYQQSLVIVHDIGDRNGEAVFLNNLGNASKLLGQYPKAIDFYQQSLSIQRQIGDRNGEGNSLMNLGIAYRKLGQYTKAIDFYQQSLSIQRQIGDRNGEAKSLVNLGNANSDVGQYAKAIDFYQQSLNIQHQIGDRDGEAVSLINFGSSYHILGQYTKAIDLYQKSLVIFRDIGNPEGERLALIKIGSIFEEHNQPELAIAFYKQSVNVQESIRQDIRILPREQQASYTKNIAAQNYRGLASLLLEKNRVMEALQILDLLKVQELQDFLRNVQGNERTVKGIELLPQEQKILQDYTAIQETAIRLGAELADLRKLQNSTPTQQQRLQELEKIQAQTNQQMSEFLKSPTVVALSQQIQQTAPQQNLTLPAYQDLQTRLQRLGKRIALFYTLVLDDRLELVLLPPGKPPIRRSVAIKRTELEKMIQTFRQDLQDPNSEVKQSSQKLYDQLIKPIEADLQQADVQSIIYAPDGQMRYIPLAALYDGKQWLTERYQINYLTALALTKLEPEPTNAPRVLAGAFTQGSYSVQVAGQTYDFQGLRFAKTEVEGLGAAIPNTTKLFDKAFNRDAILSQIKNYSIVHMATHAVFVKGAPEDSFILMGDGTRINLKEIEEWKLPNVTLVVLSACQTALGGELGTGLEILGFGYQLQRTGVRASIASLWEVNDGGTQTLMNTLYTRLKSGKITKAEAIREAQIAMITGKNQSSDSKKRSSVRLTPGNSGQSAPISLNLSHPYYWAPFILIGNGL